MNAHGVARRTASIIGALAALLLTHTAAADEVMIVSGKRMDKPATAELASVEAPSADLPAALEDEVRESINNDLRNSLRDGLQALSLELGKDESEAREVKVATLAPPTGV
jgi:hypothetical protein